MVVRCIVQRDYSDTRSHSRDASLSGRIWMQLAGTRAWSLHASHAKAEGPEGSAGRRITAVSAYGYCNTDYDESRNEITRRQEAYLLLTT